MKVMVVGSGGREYSIGLALKRDPKVTELFLRREMVQHHNLDTMLPIKIMKHWQISLKKMVLI